MANVSSRVPWTSAIWDCAVLNKRRGRSMRQICEILTKQFPDFTVSRSQLWSDLKKLDTSEEHKPSILRDQDCNAMFDRQPPSSAAASQQTKTPVLRNQRQRHPSVAIAPHQDYTSRISKRTGRKPAATKPRQSIPAPSRPKHRRPPRQPSVAESSAASDGSSVSSGRERYYDTSTTLAPASMNAQTPRGGAALHPLARCAAAIGIIEVWLPTDSVPAHNQQLVDLLHIAVSLGWIDVVRYLIERGVDPNELRSNQMTLYQSANAALQGVCDLGEGLLSAVAACFSYTLGVDYADFLATLRSQNLPPDALQGFEAGLTGWSG